MPQSRIRIKSAWPRIRAVFLFILLAVILAAIIPQYIKTADWVEVLWTVGGFQGCWFLFLAHRRVDLEDRERISQGINGGVANEIRWDKEALWYDGFFVAGDLLIGLASMAFANSNRTPTGWAFTGFLFLVPLVVNVRLYRREAARARTFQIYLDMLNQIHHGEAISHDSAGHN